MKNGLKITSLSCKRRKYVHFTNRNFIFISKSRVSVCEFGETNLFQSSFDYLDDTYTETVFGYFTFFYINRRKHWFRQNFRFPVFDGFIRFGISWSRFDYFWKMSVCLSVRLSLCLSIGVSVCMRQKFCGKCSLRTNAQNFRKLYI